MRLKHLVVAFAAVGFTAVGSAAETMQSASAQLNYLEAKVTKLEDQMGKSMTAAPASGTSAFGKTKSAF